MSGSAAADDSLGSTSRLSRSLRLFSLDRAVTSGEMALVLVGLGLVAIAALAPHLKNGGFYLDDWANAATSLSPPGEPDLGNALSSYADLTIYRPVLVLYVPLTYFAFGMHMHYHLMLAAVLAVLAATMFYGVLRVLGLPWIHAAILAALAVVFPWSDSTRLWATADQVSLSILFMMAGLLIALLGLRRSSWRWHATAAALYLLSILTYEVTLPVIACAGLLYCLQAGWRASRAKWLVDLVAVAAGGAWVGAHTARTASGLAGDLEHLRQIVSAGGTILGRATVAVGTLQTVVILLALLACVGIGTGVSLLFPDRFATKGRWGLHGWVLLSVGGVAAAALGWAMFIPADPYYTPTIFGEANRVNGLAAFGLVLAVYGCFGIIGTVLGQVRPKASALSTGITVSLGIVLLASYVHVLRRHIEIWNLAFFAETYALSKTQKELPRLPPGTTLFASSYPANQAPEVPILDTTWDFDGMIKMEYDDSSLSASPVLPGFELKCLANEVALESDGTPEVTAEYGSVRLLNLQTGEHAAPGSRKACESMVGSYPAGPLFLSPTY